MDAKIVDLQSLFGQPVSYRIPQFQRLYAWKKNGQWEPLWDDVRNIAERILESDSEHNIRPHFMGAIILQGLPSQTAEVDKRLASYELTVFIQFGN